MGTKLAPRDMELYQRVDEVLHYVWDPIGVSTMARGRDEYYMYLPDVFALVTRDVDARTIAEYLNEVTTQRMGLAKDPSHTLQVANLLLAWKRNVHEHDA
jgi:hypothetical protein